MLFIAYSIRKGCLTLNLCRQLFYLSCFHVTMKNNPQQGSDLQHTVFVYCSFDDYGLWQQLTQNNGPIIIQRMRCEGLERTHLLVCCTMYSMPLSPKMQQKSSPCPVLTIQVSFDSFQRVCLSVSTRCFSLCKQLKYDFLDAFCWKRFKFLLGEMKYPFCDELFFSLSPLRRKDA